MRRILLLLLAGFVATSAKAQDQTLQFSGFRTDVTSGSADDAPVCGLTALAKAGSITDTDVKSLRAMVAIVAKRIGVTFSKEDIAVIHLVIWGDLNIENEIWLTVTADGRWLRQNTVDARLFGSSRPLLVYIYSGLSSGVDDVAYKVTSTSKIPENIQNVIALAKAVGSGTIGAFLEPTNSCAWGAQALPLNHVPADVTIQAFAQKHAKKPPTPSLTATLTGPAAQPFSILQIKRASPSAVAVSLCKAGACTASVDLDAAGTAQFAAALCERANCEMKAFDATGKAMESLSVGPLDAPTGAALVATNKSPSSAAADGSKIQAPEVGKKVFNNEDLTWWDVSLMMQVNSISDVTYNATDGTVQPAKVTKQNLFAVADVFPFRNWERHWKIAGQFISVPVAVAIPLNSTPLSRPFFGLGLGTRAFQFMAGVSYDQVSKPTTMSVGSVSTPSKLAADSSTYRVSKFMLGINVSVTSVVNALAKSKTTTVSK